MFNVLRKGAMGDVLLLEPVLSALMAQHGQVNLLTRAVQLATRIPNLKVNQKFNTLHLNLDDSYEKDTHKLISQAYFEASGLPYLERKPDLYLTDAENAAILALKQDRGKHVILNLDYKHYTDARSVYGLNTYDWVALVRYLNQKGHHCYMTSYDQRLSGLPDYSMVIESDLGLSFLPKMSLPDLIVTIGAATAFIGMDSLPAHFANSLNIPSAIFIGSVNPEYRYLTLDTPFQFIQNPCARAGCYHEVFSLDGQPCSYRKKSSKYLQCCTYTLDQVLEKVERIL